jgi:mono/diheme cytochrome c family protein
MKKIAVTILKTALLLTLLFPASGGAEDDGAAEEPKAASPERYYAELCASCHHVNRLGRTAAPLIPQTLDKYSDEELLKIVINGIPATEMPPFKGLSPAVLDGLIALMRSPVEIKWDIVNIDESVQIYPKKKTAPRYRNIENVTAVVERGGGRIWIMEDKNILDRFDFRNVHGGLKFSPPEGPIRIFAPSRDGCVVRYDLNEGFLYGRVRPCLNLRNIALSRDGRRIIASCVLPPSLVVLDAASLRPEKVIPVEGAISAVTALYSRDAVYIAFKDRPILGILDTDTLDIRYKELDDPLEDFFIDPFERYIVGTSRKPAMPNGSTPKPAMLRAYDMGDEKAQKPRVAFEYPIEALPHLFSAAFLYRKDGFYFVTPHLGKPYVSVWRMYADESPPDADGAAGKKSPVPPFSFDHKIDIGGGGLFVATHPASPYLFADNGTDELTLIEKRDFSVRHIVPARGKNVLYAGFSGDGRTAYVSINDDDGFVILYDAATLKEFKRIPARTPFGQDNFFNSQRRFAPVNLGRDVYDARCRICHHQTQKTLAPSFKHIAATRDEAAVRAYIKDPKTAAPALGYSSGTMPELGLTPTEIDAVVSYIMYLKNLRP